MALDGTGVLGKRLGGVTGRQAVLRPLGLKGWNINLHAACCKCLTENASTALPRRQTQVCLCLHHEKRLVTWLYATERRGCVFVWGSTPRENHVMTFPFSHPLCFVCFCFSLVNLFVRIPAESLKMGRGKVLLPLHYHLPICSYTTSHYIFCFFLKLWKELFCIIFYRGTE